ncbi:MAG: TMEM175 family protein [Bryobacteraceae bacterium]
MSLKLSTSRIEALSDGVFSIAMTLLVLKLEVPDVSHHSSNMEMLGQLMAQTPAFISYVATFLIAAGFWLLHHLTFHFIRHADGLLCWINLALLMFVSLLPFSAGMMGHLFVHSVSQVFYFGNQFAIASLLYLHLYYATHARMAAIDSDPVAARRLTYRIAVLPIAFGGAIATAFLAPMYSILCFAAVFVAGIAVERLSR